MPWVKMGIIDSPCRKCNKHSITCHGDCKKYKQYQKDLEEAKKRLRTSEGRQRRVF